MSDAQTPQLEEYLLNPGYIYIPGKPTLISMVVGSCVAVCLWDKARAIGGVNHFMFPVTRDPKEATAIYGNVATQTLIRLFLGDGSKRKHLEAQLYGGASPPDGDLESARIGRENADTARRMLRENKIPVVSEDTGGSKGRKIVFNTSNNEIVVLKVDRLRRGDWYPYNGKR